MASANEPRAHAPAPPPRHVPDLIPDADTVLQQVFHHLVRGIVISSVIWTFVVLYIIVALDKEVEHSVHPPITHGFRDHLGVCYYRIIEGLAGVGAAIAEIAMTIGCRAMAYFEGGDFHFAKCAGMYHRHILAAQARINYVPCSTFVPNTLRAEVCHL